MVNIDASWCIENIELATEYFKEKQNENANLENGSVINFVETSIM